MRDNSDRTEGTCAVDHKTVQFLSLGQGQACRIDFIWIAISYLLEGFSEFVVRGRHDSKNSVSETLEASAYAYSHVCKLEMTECGCL